MKIQIHGPAAIFFFLGAWVLAASAAAQSGAMLSKAKAEAEAKGYIFETSRDAIVAMAKKEGKLVVFSSQEADTIRAVAEAFRKNTRSST